ncbi:MAG: hypothetical protein WAL12_20960 [Trebonia sp.]
MDDLEHLILGYLWDREPTTPAELARDLNLSEDRVMAGLDRLHGGEVRRVVRSDGGAYRAVNPRKRRYGRPALLSR